MKALMISGFAAIALLAAATTLLWSHSVSADRHVRASSGMSVQQLHATPEVNKLPTEEFNDMTFVYSATPRP